MFKYRPSFENLSNVKLCVVEVAFDIEKCKYSVFFTPESVIREIVTCGCANENFVKRRSTINIVRCSIRLVLLVTLGLSAVLIFCVPSADN